MTVELKSQFILITDIIDGQLVQEKYIFYSLTKKRFIKKHGKRNRKNNL